MSKLTVLNTAISWYSHKDEDFISLTDMARYRDSERTNYIIQNWCGTGIPSNFLVCGSS